ncbi:MAG: OmpH family outer membrane protein [Verrucomicrobiota bacterium]|nr:OmpH family outer membrane protein [Verrucomicrobiota bacterium]
MKTKTMWMAAGMAALALTGSVAAPGKTMAAGKTVVADMSSLIKAHPDARAAEATMKKYMDEFEAEQKQIVEDAEKLKTEFDKIREESQNKALSDEARDRKKKEAEEKFAKIREFEQKAQKQLGLRQRQIADQHKRLREAIVAKLRKVIKEYAEKNGCSLILNSDAVGTGAEAVVYHADGTDITAEILKAIGAEAEDGNQ